MTPFIASGKRKVFNRLDFAALTDMGYSVLPQSYTVLRLLGGAYLFWIAVQMWRHAADPLALEGESAAGH